MGYSHRWTMTDKAQDDNAWLRFYAAAAIICSRARRRGVGIAGWDGEGSPEFTEGTVCLNGRGSQSYETFRIDRDGGSSCKTNHRPYDVAVVAILTAGERLGVLTWDSDGEASEHAAGIALCPVEARAAEVTP